MIKIRAVRAFHDKAAGVDREVGEEWQVDQKRLAAINSTKYGKLAERVNPPRRAASKKKAEGAE